MTPVLFAVDRVSTRNQRHVAIATAECFFGLILVVPVPLAPAIVFVLLLREAYGRVLSRRSGLLVAGRTELAVLVQRTCKRLDVLLRVTTNQEVVPEIALPRLTGEQVALGYLQDVATITVGIRLSDAVTNEAGNPFVYLKVFAVNRPAVAGPAEKRHRIVASRATTRIRRTTGYRQRLLDVKKEWVDSRKTVCAGDPFLVNVVMAAPGTTGFRAKQWLRPERALLLQRLSRRCNKILELLLTIRVHRHQRYGTPESLKRSAAALCEIRYRR